MADHVRTLLNELREDLRSDELLQLELAASHALAVLDLETLLDGLGRVHKEYAGYALTLLRATMWLTEPDDELDARFTRVEAQLRERGGRSTAPADAGAVDVDRCALLRDRFADELTLFIGVDGPEHDDHTLIVDLVQSFTFELGSVRVGAAFDDVLENARGSLATEPDAADHFELVEISAVDAGVLLYSALDSVDEEEHISLDEDSLELLALVDARARELFDELLVTAGAFANPERPHVVAATTRASELDALDAVGIAELFVASDEFTAADGTDVAFAGQLATWATEVPSGGRARVSPAVLDLLLEDIGASDGTFTPEQLPTVRAWVDWCARLTELPTRARTELDALLGGPVAS
jgi:hypothetical protein